MPEILCLYKHTQASWVVHSGLTRTQQSNLVFPLMPVQCFIQLLIFLLLASTLRVLFLMKLSVYKIQIKRRSRKKKRKKENCISYLWHPQTLLSAPADSPSLNGDLTEGKCNALTISACGRKLLNSLSGTWQQKTDLASERACQWKLQMIAVQMPCFLFSLFLELFSRLRAHKFCALCVSGHSCIGENAKH